MFYKFYKCDIYIVGCTDALHIALIRVELTTLQCDHDHSDPWQSNDIGNIYQ